MSYNISSWKVKKLNNLKIPLKAFYKHAREDWHPDKPEIIDFQNNKVSIGCGCGQEIKGILKDAILEVTELDMAGEGSGTFMDWIFEPALKESTGELEAVTVWEGGDNITKITVKNGNIQQENIEL